MNNFFLFSSLIVSLPMLLAIPSLLRDAIKGRLKFSFGFFLLPVHWLQARMAPLFSFSFKKRTHHKKQHTAQDSYKDDWKPKGKTRVSQRFLSNWTEHFHPSKGKFNQMNPGVQTPLPEFYDQLYMEIYKLKSANYKSLWREVFKLIHPDKAADRAFTAKHLTVFSQYYNTHFPKS